MGRLMGAVAAICNTAFTMPAASDGRTDDVPNVCKEAPDASSSTPTASNVAPDTRNDAARRDADAGWIAKIRLIPLSFLGIGFYRAWVELAFVRPVIDIPAMDASGRDIFDIGLIATLLICALLSKRIAPLAGNKWPMATSALLVVGGSAMIAASCFLPQIAPYVKLPATIMSGVGLGFMILMWSELYGCLNPVKIAIFFSASFLIGALTVFVCRGFNDAYMAGSIVVLPVLSLICISRSYWKVPKEERPRKEVAVYSFPWKPILLMAVYAFAYGICESHIYVAEGPHSSIGVIVAAGITFVIALGSSKARFSFLFKFFLPLMVFGLLVPMLLPDNAFVANLFVNMSFASFSIAIMLILGSLCYRWKMSAVFLFGIERGLRALVMMLGRDVHSLMYVTPIPENQQTAFLYGIVIIAIVTATSLLMTEKDLTSKWGIDFLGADDQSGHETEAIAQNNLADNCHMVSEKYNLTHREAEVLYLLAEKKSISRIERELFIANGTVKAHVRHIYEKLDIHSRDELYTIMGTEDREAPDGGEPCDSEEPVAIDDANR